MKLFSNIKIISQRILKEALGVFSWNKKVEVCPLCEGGGYIIDKTVSGNTGYLMDKCPKCKGRGWYVD